MSTRKLLVTGLVAVVGVLLFESEAHAFGRRGGCGGACGGGGYAPAYYGGGCYGSGYTPAYSAGCYGGCYGSGIGGYGCWGTYAGAAYPGYSTGYGAYPGAYTFAAPVVAPVTVAVTPAPTVVRAGSYTQGAYPVETIGYSGTATDAVITAGEPAAVVVDPYGVYRARRGLLRR